MCHYQEQPPAFATSSQKCKVKNAKPDNGEFVYHFCNNILVMKFIDKRPELMMSSLHRAELVDTWKDRHGKAMTKPTVINDYKRFISAVDRNDELVGFYSSLRKSLKWYKKLAFTF